MVVLVLALERSSINGEVAKACNDILLQSLLFMSIGSGCCSVWVWSTAPGLAALQSDTLNTGFCKGRAASNCNPAHQQVGKTSNVIMAAKDGG